MSCVLNVLHGGTKQGKAYAAAYALLTRAQVLLTHVIGPYADLTRTIFSTSPQFRLTRSYFYCKNRSSDWQNQAVDDEDVEEEEEDDEEVPPAEAHQARS